MHKVACSRLVESYTCVHGFFFLKICFACKYTNMWLVMFCRYKKSLGMSIVFNSVSTAYGQTKDYSYIDFS